MMFMARFFELMETCPYECRFHVSVLNTRSTCVLFFS